MKKPEVQEKQMVAERQLKQLLGHVCTTLTTVASNLLRTIRLPSKVPAEAMHLPVEKERVRLESQER
jgi:hypothetical protein